MFKSFKIKANNKGLTLIEIIVAMALFSVMGLMFITAASSAMKMNAETRKWNNEIDYQEQNVEVRDDAEADRTDNLLDQKFVFTPTVGVMTSGEINAGYYRYDTKPDADTKMDDPTSFSYFAPKEVDPSKYIYKVIIENPTSTSQDYYFSMTGSYGHNDIVGVTGSIRHNYSETPCYGIPLHLGPDEIAAVWIEFSSDDAKNKIGTAEGDIAFIKLSNTSITAEEHTYIKLNDLSPSLNSELIEGVIWAVPKATSSDDLNSGIPLFEIIYE